MCSAAEGHTTGTQSQLSSSIERMVQRNLELNQMTVRTGQRAELEGQAMSFVVVLIQENSSREANARAQSLFIDQDKYYHAFRYWAARQKRGTSYKLTNPS